MQRNHTLQLVSKCFAVFLRQFKDATAEFLMQSVEHKIDLDLAWRVRGSPSRAAPGGRAGKPRLGPDPRRRPARRPDLGGDAARAHRAAEAGALRIPALVLAVSLGRGNGKPRKKLEPSRERAHLTPSTGTLPCTSLPNL